MTGTLVNLHVNGALRILYIVLDECRQPVGNDLSGCVRIAQNGLVLFDATPHWYDEGPALTALLTATGPLCLPFATDVSPSPP